ncbi:MAG TPA: beta-galactosidase, partial [Armatimonadota bacterium]
MRYFNNLRVILVLLVLTLCGVDQVWAANGVALPAPVVGWNCALPPEAKFGDVINYDSETFTGLGSDVALNQFRFLPSLVHPAFAAQCRVRWSQGEGGEDAVACVMRDVSAESSAVLQCGNGGGTLNGATQCTLYMKFRLVLPMSTGGGGPVPQELDGYLLQLASNLTLMVSGRGKTGREKHRPTLVISGTLPNATQRYESRYQPQLDDELQIGPWYRLVLTWDGSQPEDFKSQPGDTKRVRLWLNGKEYPMKRTGTLTASPAILQVNGPVLVGGNRQRNNAPLDLAGFAIYNSALADGQVALLNTQGLGKHVAGKKTVVSPPAYERIPAGNHPEGWRDAPAAFSFTTVNDDMLKITFADVAKDAVNACYLKQPLALDTGVATVNYWACFPADSTCGIALTPLFTDAKGKEIAGTSNGFFSHIAPPNSRKGGQWRYFTIAVPRKEGAVTFVGYSLKVTNTPQGKASGTLYVKDLGLDRINYAQAQLYYVVGNYRDNFSMPEFNGSGARALADQSAGSVVPYLLLDNVVDQAKRGRPLQLNLQLSAYDTQDRLVYASTVSNLPAQGVPDFFRQLPIPLTKPGTYRIKGKSYNAATGEYFTTDWVKLIIVKGSAKPVTTVPETGLLAINPAKPYGRLEKTDKAEITFSVGRLPNAGACELRYTVIPYELWVPVFQAVRPVTCEQKVLVTKPGNITVPYTPHRTVELVVAELWQGGKRLEHEERPIGIRNELDKAPAFVTRANIPSLDDQAGPGKQWINTHFTDDLGQDPKQHMARNIDEAKQHSANIGFRVDMNRLEPIPGVYDWDYLTPMFDMAAEKGCRMIPYLNLKWPVDWAPVEFQVDADGTVHRVGTLWGYMVGKYLYPNGEYAPQIIKQFCTQFARQYLNHPGLGGYYFENEHIDTTWANGVIDSHHEAARQHFAQYLAKRYGAIARLNAAYGRAYATFANVALPGKDADSPKALLADYNRFMYEGAQRFILDNEFDPVRQEDPQRPIIVYMFGSMSDAFLQHVAANGGILANGGVHSNFDADIWYDRYTAVPGLRCRMEPHGMWSYNPIPNGFDEMIFGML